DLSNGQVLYLTDVGDHVPVDQTAAPSGPTTAGQPWQDLGQLSSDGELRVDLPQSPDGSVAAGQVRIVQVGYDSPLKVVDLSGDPLSSTSLDVYLPQLNTQVQGNGQSGTAGAVYSDADANPPVLGAITSPV